MEIQHVYIVGAKNMGRYGGYETFLDKLTEYHRDNQRIRYHVAWKGNEKKEFEYHGAHCFQMKVPEIGPAQAIYYDVAALHYCMKHMRENQIVNPIVYILACRIGPWAGYFAKKIHERNGKMFVNPDGHEWMRSKWSIAVRKYWKFSEGRMVRYADLLVCDSRHIEEYMKSTYKRYQPKTIYIAYGAELVPSILADDDEKVTGWYQREGLYQKGYYLIVGRFVPENSFETMLREFMQTKTERKLVLITTPNQKFMKKLEKTLGFKNDPRIQFVGAVYDVELLKKIRENAYAYLHGHTVGGTNPSLIEALGSTDLNLLAEVKFNREVAKDSAFYWGWEPGKLAELIDRVDAIPWEEIKEMGRKAKNRVLEEYTWDHISSQYEKLFIES